MSQQNQKNNDTVINVIKIVASQINKNENEIAPEHTFENLNVDILDHIEIIMRTEETFNIEINDEKAEEIICVKDLINCVEQLVKEEQI